jgi:hypothetical protein
MVGNQALKQLFQHKWPVDEYGIARLNVRLGIIAENSGLEVQSWDDNDGLGPRDSICFQLPSGLVVGLVEHKHAIKHFKEKGPVVLADAADVVKVGLGHVVDEVLSALRLDRMNVDWQNEIPPSFTARVVP